MSEPLNTYGLTPLKFWKLFDIDGWQLLVVAEVNDDDNGFSLVYSTAFEELGSTVDFKIGYSTQGEPSQKVEDILKDIFEKIDEEAARKAMQVVLDNAGPAVLKMLGREGGSFGDMQVSEIAMKDGTKVRFDTDPSDED